MIKVAYIARPNLFSVPGGDTVQLKNTARELEKLGVQADIWLSGQLIPYADYDLLHFFNIIDCEDLLGHAQRAEKPYCISTIYVDYREYDRGHRGGLIGKLSSVLPYNSVEYLKTLAKRILKGEKVSSTAYWWKGHGGSIRYLLNHAACLLPNSENEYRRLQKDYPHTGAHQVVPNGFDPTLFKAPVPQPAREGVICVGRIEGRKNQLNLIRALNGSGLKLTLIGPVAPNQAAYYEQCRKEAGPLVQFVEHMPQEELLEWYSRSKVHVLPSWFETTGLSSLEAAAMGCQLVVANRGDVYDYFGNYAYYCEPGDVASIREAVLQANNAAVNEELRDYVHKHFTWTMAAEATIKAYREVLQK